MPGLLSPGNCGEGNAVRNHLVMGIFCVVRLADPEGQSQRFLQGSPTLELARPVTQQQSPLSIVTCKMESPGVIAHGHCADQITEGRRPPSWAPAEMEGGRYITGTATKITPDRKSVV